MSRTFLRQDTQIRQSDLYDDTLTVGSTLESAPVDIEGDLNALRSQAKRALVADNAGDWFQDINTPSTFENGAKRGITNLNTDLHELERKRVLVSISSLIDVTVPAAAQATGTFTSTGVFSDGETVTIGAQTYTFKSPFVDAADNIDASGTTAQTHENLRRAINGDGVAGTNYGTGTLPNTKVTATDTASSNVLTAILAGTAANLVATTTTCANAAFADATLTGGAGDVVILTLGQLPANTTAAIGAVATRGTVAANNATFGVHSLAEVAGSTAISPKNFVEIFDATTRDPLFSPPGGGVPSVGRVVYALFQTESATDGSTMTGTTPNRAQLSFVRINATGDDLEAVPAADIGGLVINYANVERKALDDLNEQDFLRGAIMDVPAATTVTRQVGYNNQGTTPVELTTNATLDLNAAGIAWKLRDLTNADLLSVTEGSTGGTSTIAVAAAVDVFDVNAVINDFSAGIKANTGSQEIDIGVNAGIIESTGANNLRLLGAVKLKLDDSYQPGSTWVATDGVSLADASSEWSAFKTAYGEVSLLNAIVAAKNAFVRGTKVYATVTLTTNADDDVGGVGGGTNLSAQLPNMSGGSFLNDYDVFLNGNLLRPGANSSANNDYYPGTSLANGQLKFEFKVKAGTVPDVLCVIPYA